VRKTLFACVVIVFSLVVGNAPVWAAGDAKPRNQVAPDDEMPERVRQAVLHAWQGYKQYAWGHDDLNPLSRTPYDWYAGQSLLMTPVDSYDTLVLLGLTSEAAEAKQLILDRLSFDRDVSAQVFEVTIRLLGGLLSAYQLDQDPRWLHLATDLGTRLLPAFKSPTGMPYRFVNLRTGAVEDSVSNPAEIGTLLLEFGTLAKLTQRPEFYDTAKRAVVELYKRRSPLGLVGSTINVRTGAWVDSTSHVGGGIDSYYEYLLKSARLFQDLDLGLMWRESATAMNRYLADERFEGLWYGQVNMSTGQRVGTQFGALEAFLPAVLALCGDTKRAGTLMDSVLRMWTTFGVEPEVLDYSDMRIDYPGYELRPEAMESAYYLYRLTGDKRYQQMGREMFEAIEKWTKNETGYAALKDVRTKVKRDRMHSFLIAETFKYAYLLFAPTETIDLNNVVFNTEAHPLQKTW
jgi:mannosidase alpha-like ER degradation enhancer 2